jgi:hypothetical protein
LISLHNIIENFIAFSCTYVSLPLHKLSRAILYQLIQKIGNRLPSVTEPSQKWDICRFRIDRGILDETRMHKYITKAYNIIY